MFGLKNRFEGLRSENSSTVYPILEISHTKITIPYQSTNHNRETVIFICENYSYICSRIGLQGCVLKFNSVNSSIILSLLIEC